METLERTAMRKVTRRFMPLLFLCFVAAFLDRANVGFAALTMNRDLGFSQAVFGFGAGLFFLTYFVFEIPSNLALERFGARVWLARIMITWGVVAGATAFINGPTSFYIVRLLLGAAEAGFGPGAMFFLTLWFPAAYRARALALFLVSVPVASVIGGPVSGYLIGLHGLAGLKGWQIMFLIEAIPSVVLGCVIWFVFTNDPKDARWLDAKEKTWLIDTLAAERLKRPVTVHGIARVLVAPYLWALAAAFFGIVGLIQGMGFFLPQIVHAFHLSLQMTGIISAIPFLAAAIAMPMWGKRSDARNERPFHVLFPLALAVIGLGGSTFAGSPALKLLLITIACAGAWCSIVVFWALVSDMVPATAAAACIAMVNCLGNLSGFVDLYLIGIIKDMTGSFDGGLQLLSVLGVLSGVLLAAMLYGRRLSRGHATSIPE
ncbi:membrane protein [Caballeronia jiangsuensis]|nr:membrane protein [Caballeronia jiangsuensis]